MSHPVPSQENSYPEDKVTHFKTKRRPYGRASQTIQGWADSLKSPHEKALDKSKRRHEKKLKTAN